MPMALEHFLKRATDLVLNPFGFELRRTAQEHARRSARTVTQSSLARVLTAEMERLNQGAAARVGVDPAVHPKDDMYWYALGSVEASADLSANINGYFEDGARSGAQLADIVRRLGYGPNMALRLLEFAAGYGKLSRHLIRQPQYDLVSCDIHTEAVDFLAKQLGVRSMGSAHVPEDLAITSKHDVVFALSFFTHMPRATWGRWLKALSSLLASPGYLIFTTHGAKQCEAMGIPREGLPDGFWFSAQSEQTYLDTADYGSTISLPDFVIGEIYNQTGSPIVLYEHAAWWNSQDLWVVKKE